MFGDFDINKCLEYSFIEGPLKSEKIEILNGANYFSAGPIVKIRLNLGQYDEVFTNSIEGFFEKLQAKLPSLIEHHCSPGIRGGFFQRVIEGTLLGHVVEHVAIELQTLAGMDVAYGKTRSTLTQGVYNVIFRFFDDEAGIYAGKVALNLINSILLNKDFDVEEAIVNLILIREFRLLGPSTQSIVLEAESRGIPTFRMDEYNLVQLGTGKYNKKIRATITSDTNYLGVEIADNKFLTIKFLKDAGVPVPKTARVSNIEQSVEFWRNINKPVSLKPIEGSLGKNISCEIDSEKDIIQFFNDHKNIDTDYIIQENCIGNSYRILVIDYKFIAATKLIPAFILGDGKKSIKELIEILNNDPKRKIGDKSSLSKVVIDDNTLSILKKKNYTFDTVLSIGEKLFLQLSGNPKLGGTSIDVTDKIDPYNIFIAERASRSIGLNIAGVDIISEDISIPMNINKGVVLEVNAAPDFRMHIMPTEGEVRNVAKPIVDNLFPLGEKFRIPIISITGTAGKTTTAYLIDFCLRKQGIKTGLTTTEGLYITQEKIMDGDMTFPRHVNLVLQDKTIECAILETSREGILRKGLGYKFADIGILLNVEEDHLGVDDIKYIEDLAYAKSVVAEEVYEDGYSILNADDKLVMEVYDRLFTKAILFSQDNTNTYIRKHLRKNGIVVLLDKMSGNINLGLNGKLLPIININEVPLTDFGKARYQYTNVLASIAALYGYGVKLEDIKQSILEFTPDFNNLPGRMNLFKINDKKVFLDYAHNKGNFLALKSYLENFTEVKIGVIDAAGDRSDIDIKALGEIAAQTYVKLYIYEGIDMRERKDGEILNLLKEGALKGGMKEENIYLFNSAEKAWSAAIDNQQINEMLVILSARPFITKEKLFSI